MVHQCISLYWVSTGPGKLPNYKRVLLYQTSLSTKGEYLRPTPGMATYRCSWGSRGSTGSNGSSKTKETSGSGRSRGSRRSRGSLARRQSSRDGSNSQYEKFPNQLFLNCILSYLFLLHFYVKTSSSHVTFPLPRQFIEGGTLLSALWWRRIKFFSSQDTI